MDYLTEAGLLQIKQELKELRTTKRLEISNRLKEAAAFGDLSENAEYVEAKEAEAFLEGRVKQLEGILRSSQVVVPLSQEIRSDAVGIGSAIHVQSGKDKHVFNLVGKEEANPVAGKVSSSSPVGRALLWKKVGDEFYVMTPGGKKKFKITKIA